jgi:hypothetical protein
LKKAKTAAMLFVVFCAWLAMATLVTKASDLLADVSFHYSARKSLKTPLEVG